jgi:voltage-gated sodium channel
MEIQYKVNSFSWLYFFTFIILIAFIFMNMIVGIIVDSVSQESLDDDSIDREILKKLEDIEKKIG